MGIGGRVTLLESGMVDTLLLHDTSPDVLRPQDVGRSVICALQQPPSVDVHELAVLPTPPQS